MATEIILPTLGESELEATLAAWLFHVGDKVHRGDELAEVETDKATLPIECPTNGVILAVLAAEGETLQPGQLLAVVGREGETWKATDDSRAAAEPAEDPAGNRAPARNLSTRNPPARRDRETSGRRTSPAARRKARELGVAIDQVTPPEPGARITSADVERHAAGANAAGARAGRQEPAGHRDRLVGLRRLTAERMAISAREIPQFSVTAEADADPLLAAHRAYRQRGAGAPITLTSLLVHLISRTLSEHPLLNARFDGPDGVMIYDVHNIGVAVATDDGLTVPVLHDVASLSVSETAARLHDLAGRARSRRLGSQDLAGATFTVSNLGMLGVKALVPLVNPPQSAILGIGAARPVFVPDAADPRTFATSHRLDLTVAADHRVVDGYAAASFLAALSAAMETLTPEVLE